MPQRSGAGSYRWSRPRRGSAPEPSYTGLARLNRAARGRRPNQHAIPEHETLLPSQPPPATIAPIAEPAEERRLVERANSLPYHRYAADNDGMEQMDSMFRAPEQRTDFSSLVNEESEIKPAKKFSESDFQGHFRENQYAKPHEPLKPSSKPKKKKSETAKKDAGAADEEHDQETADPSTAGEVPSVVVTGDEPRPSIDNTDGGINFELGQDEDDEGRQKERKHRRHHRVEDPSERRVPGSERRPQRSAAAPAANDAGVVDDDDADAMHMEDISSHRFDDPNHRRHKVKKKEDRNITNVVQLNDIGTGQTLLLGKKTFDHTPHDMFVQMDELIPGMSENEYEWQETARWIKYEEDVEQGADRWGKPHLTSLSFQSLMNLRRCLEKGTILLDVEEHDSVAISHRISTALVNEDQIQQADFGAVMRTLLLRRHHVDEGGNRGLRNYMSSRNSRSMLQSLADIRNQSARSLAEVEKAEKEKDSKGSKNTLSVMSSSHGQIPRHNSVGGESTQSSDDVRRFMAHHNILRCMAPGTETFSVNVGRVEFVSKPVAAFVRLAEGTYLPGITEMPLPVRFIFFLIGPPDVFEDYNETGRAFATLMSSPSFHEAAYKAENRNDLMWAFKEFLDDTLVLPPIDWTANPDVLDVHELQMRSREIQERKKEKLAALERRRDGKGEQTNVGGAANGAAGGDGEQPPDDNKEDLVIDDPLERKGRPFAGLIRDIRRRYPWYLSDFKDGLNGAVLSAAFFIFFAALAGAITFGGLMMDKTFLQIGISETLISTSIAGLLFGFLSGQPLIIIGTTGPVLLFDEALYQFADFNNLEFLPMRVWIAIWMLVLSLVLVGLEGSVLVKKFTRFTTEIFSSLVSILFIFESLAKLATVFQDHPLMMNYCSDLLFLRSLSLLNLVGGEEMAASTAVSDGLNSTTTGGNATLPGDAPLDKPRNQPNTALLSSLLMFGTFAIAQYLRYFRNSKFLGRRVRRMLGDFGVPIAILLMVGVDQLVPMVYTQTLQVPEGLTPTDPQFRGWFISPLGLHKPITWLAIVGGLPAAGLIFIVIYMETMVCQLIMAKPERNLKKGTGFHLDIVLISVANLISALMGAPWQCAATIRSVSHAAALTIMSTTHAPGDKPMVVGVYEQRLSAILVSLVLGLSVFMSTVMELIPVSVVFGVFLYMGISSMTGVQMLERCVLFLKPVKHHPDEPYVKRVRTWRMHMYTIIQMLCLGGLLGIKFTPAAIGFPFFLALMIPLRLILLPKLFSQVELNALDGDGSTDDPGADEPDFYEEAHTMPSGASQAQLYGNSSIQLLRVPSSLNPKV